MAFNCPTVMPGSSPLARGLLGLVEDSLSDLGIIPARAGFTARPGPERRRLPDHPRSRGVYAADALGKLSQSGSSPLARGLLAKELVWLGGDGIIPARAGFTSPVIVTVSPAFGSSPLARGLPHQ